MIRAERSKALPFLAALLGAAAVFAAPWTVAQAKAAPAAQKKHPAKSDEKESSAPAAKPSAAAKSSAAAKPSLVGTFGDWNAYVALGKDPTCYVLAAPKERAPEALKRDPAYVFISTRPVEKVHNEISIMMGFDVKADTSVAPVVQIGKVKFDMLTKGSDLWLKDDSQGSAMIAAMKKNPKMIVKAASAKGNVTTDSYVLTGMVQALDKALKSCK